MATYDYSKLAAKILILVNRFGAQGCSVMRPSGVVADPSMPWKGTDSPDQVVVPTCAVLLGGISRYKMGGPVDVLGRGESPDPSESSTVFMAGADGALAKDGDYIQVPMGDGTFDRLVIDKASPLKPGGVNLLWQITLRT